MKFLPGNHNYWIDHFEMIILQIKLGEANGQIGAYEARSLSMEAGEKKRKSDLTARENEIKTCWKNIVTSQKSPLQGYPGVSQRSLAQNCQLVMTLAKQAEGDFGKASSEFATAGRIDGGSNTLLIDDQAEALIGKAMVMTRLMNLHTTIKRLSDRAQRVKNMGDVQIKPVVPEIAKFLTETKGVASKIVDSYKQAVKFRISAVKKTRDLKSKLQYQRALANTHEAYAVSLMAAGNTDQGVAEMKKAEDLNAKISKSN